MPDLETLPNATGVEGHDDGFTPEERAQFEAMQTESPAPAQTTPEPAEQPVTVQPEAPEQDDDDETDDEPVANAEPPKPGEQRQPKRVAYGKYRRTEEKAKKLETDLAAERAERQREREERTRLDERLKLINEALMTPAEAKKQEEEDPRPDPEQDIFGFVAWQQRQIDKMAQQLSGANESRQAEDRDRQVAEHYMTDAQVFAQQEPNFIPAYKFLMDNRKVELAQYFFGKDLTDPGTPSLTPPEIARIKNTVAAEEKQLVAEAINSNQSPAKRVFALARARGFRPQVNGEAQKPNGQTEKPAQAAPGSLATAPSIKDEIDRVKAGTEAAMSLSMGGGSPGTPLTAERLANMPQHEFDTLMDSMTPAQQRQLMGG